MYSNEKQNLLSLLPSRFKGAYIAGGAVTSVFTNTEIADVDVFFKTKEAFENAVVDAVEDGLYLVNVSKRALTFAYGKEIIQLCYTGFFETPDDIFQSFDFTVCMGALDLDSGEFTLHSDFLKHNSQRFLKFNPKTKYPIASMQRIFKYQKKGYTIGRGEQLKVLFTCMKTELTSWEEAKDQIGGTYGYSVSLEKEGNCEFSLDALIESLDSEVQYAKDDSNIPLLNWDDYSYGHTILRHIGFSVTPTDDMSH